MVSSALFDFVVQLRARKESGWALSGMIQLEESTLANIKVTNTSNVKAPTS